MEPVYFPIIGIARLTHFLQGLKIKFSGAENIPATGGAVLAMNHTGYTEFIYAHIPAREHKRYVRYMAKKEVFDSKITGPIMRALKHIEVDRSAGADSYRNAVAALQSGELIGVYPEATISRSFGSALRADARRKDPSEGASILGGIWMMLGVLA